MSSKKGNGHDPFTYGQVQFGGTKEPAAAAEPDDILFQGGGSAPAADSGWDMPASPDPDLLGGAATGETIDFGADILGQEAPAAAAAPARSTKPAKSRSATPARESGRPKAAPGAAARLAVPEVPAATDGEPRKQSLNARPPSPFRRPPRWGAFGAALPFVLLAASVGAAAAVWVMAGNPVLAGFAAALGGVATAFAWIWTRN